MHHYKRIDLFPLLLLLPFLLVLQSGKWLVDMNWDLEFFFRLACTLFFSLLIFFFADFLLDRGIGMEALRTGGENDDNQQRCSLH